MAEEYISRKSVRDAIASLSIERFELTPAYRLYVEALDNVDKRVVKIPAADVEPVVRGKWKPIDLTYGRNYYFCSACEETVDVPTVMGMPKFRYCPNCGAKMEGER